MFRPVLVCVLLVSCGSSLPPAVRRPDGGYHLMCGSALQQCIQQAEALCKGRGYMVLGGMSRRTLYGAELGVSQVEQREAELDIACADRRGDLPSASPAAALPADSSHPSNAPRLLRPSAPPAPVVRPSVPAPAPPVPSSPPAAPPMPSNPPEPHPAPSIPPPSTNPPSPSPPSSLPPSAPPPTAPAPLPPSTMPPNMLPPRAVPLQ